MHEVRASSSVGIGWRQPHYQALMQQRPDLGFLQVHSENFFAPGGAARQVLLRAREHYEISLHGVGLSLGSAAGLDPWHLDQLARLVEELQPLRVSDHASFARVPGIGKGPALHVNDLLPISFNASSLDIMVANVQAVQERLRRPLLVENLSAYLAWEDDQIAEPEFFNALVRRSGCALLLDVNNLVVNALNRGVDDAAAVSAACSWIDALSPGVVGEIHLAGFARTHGIVIDDHGSRVHAPVWLVYRHALQRMGVVPSLIEWDTDVPELAVLLDEAALMQDCLRAAVAPR
ncbi:DUF692 domain-containing protein [Paucibacter sp. PLA-PC-4]|uniref:DUF692 domain-containing protein n=1 Tax=Paucibacter sp. PLA-PC-4 TaxID=2993655 RepID=UPI002248F3BF|nr:DUF692 domain-containing protein [Paucibacter sp. PLA-PC-4]MCX2861793.1 DUF692 domain-containing protein [Paucibacter sp. PLA-PC-4]